MAADLLQSIVNKAKDRGLLSLPIEVGYTSDFPVIQYTDDTLMIMEASSKQLFALKALLNTFADSTGLKVNYAKSSIIPMNVPPGKMQHLAATFHCQVGELPFTYLGCPLSHKKPSTQDCLPLVIRVEWRLISTSIFLSPGGKLQMVNSVLSSLPTFYMCSIKIPVENVNRIEKYRRHCRWRWGLEWQETSLGSLEASDQTKVEGSLGVIRLRLQNEALLLENLHKFFTKADIPCVKL
jgi:hypothetical protein